MCEYVTFVVILVVVTLFSGVMLGVFDYSVLNKSYHKLSKNVISLCALFTCTDICIGVLRMKMLLMASIITPSH